MIFPQEIFDIIIEQLPCFLRIKISRTCQLFCDILYVKKNNIDQSYSAFERICSNTYYYPDILEVDIAIAHNKKNIALHNTHLSQFLSYFSAPLNCIEENIYIKYTKYLHTINKKCSELWDVKLAETIHSLLFYDNYDNAYHHFLVIVILYLEEGSTFIPKKVIFDFILSMIDYKIILDINWKLYCRNYKMCKLFRKRLDCLINKINIINDHKYKIIFEKYINLPLDVKLEKYAKQANIETDRLVEIILKYKPNNESFIIEEPNCIPIADHVYDTSQVYYFIDLTYVSTILKIYNLYQCETYRFDIVLDLSNNIPFSNETTRSIDFANLLWFNECDMDSDFFDNIVKCIKNGYKLSCKAYEK